ncbi:MAG: CheR family methyltransferase [Desulfotignum sp.]|jgi:two-component system CheB/CheR fusion protein|nr:CheR family methyltransferase [Desulfotignum sp.]
MAKKEKTKDKNRQPADQPDNASSEQKRFPVVGVGASAGGLEALEQFISGLPEKNGMAFVIVIHTHPDHPTRIPELLRRKSPVKVVLIQDAMTVETDTVYVPPSDRDTIIENGVLRLQDRPERSHVHMPVDIFLRSLAEERGDRAGCIILSGTGTDGTGGLRLIKENAGVAVAQDQKSARHTGMPASAIDTGMVDYVMTPREMADQLIAYFRHPAALKTERQENAKPPEQLSEILSFLADHTDHDFSHYKKNTVVRRIERRMMVNQCGSMGDYLAFLQKNPDETHRLFQDLLIGVTNFFRDPEVFDFVEKEVLPELFSQGGNNENVRVWVAGCSTGEEAYSIAIIILETMEKLGIKRFLQIFATDIDADAITKARQGIYPKNIAADVSKTRLDTFFNEEKNHYRINKDIREMIVFAEQNVLRDPPFMHLEMLVCRNLLIYLEPAAQNKLIPLFHYNLKPSGILFLGTSEHTGRFEELFTPVHKRFSIYKKRDQRSPLSHPIPFPSGGNRTSQQTRPGKSQTSQGRDAHDREIARIMEKKLLQHHTPACVVVSAFGDILYFHGRTGKFLEHAQGKSNLKITEMAREGLRHALSTALRKAVDNNEKVVQSNVRVKTNGSHVHINLTVQPFDGPAMKDHYMVLFTKLPASFSDFDSRGENAEEVPKNEAARKIAGLEKELADLKEDFRTTEAELETANEELKSANEEMYSSNEELQSTNEELESSREELESLNEELSTVNSELHQKVTEVQEAYSRITDVLNSTGIAILFLDNDLKIRRFTKEASRLINLIEKDVDRPLDHISHNLDIRSLKDKVGTVLRQLSASEEEVRTTDGRWYRMRIMPHRTDNNKIEGVVLTFINIDPQKAAQKKLDDSLHSAKQFADAIVDTVRESLVVLDADKQVDMANRRYYETFQTSPEKTQGRYFFDLENSQWDIPELRQRLEDITRHDRAFQDYEIAHHSKTTGYKLLRLNARRLRDADPDQDRILLAIETMNASEAQQPTDKKDKP